MSMFLKDSKDEKTVLAGRFELLRLIGSGAFGKVYVAFDKAEGENVAIKLETHNIIYSILLHEKLCYDILQGWKRIPNIRYFGQDQGRKMIVMDLLGPSVEILFRKVHMQFTIKTVLMLADQMISSLEYLHNKSIVHRDIKPDNFVMGVGNRINKVYLIDFGLAKLYKNPDTNEHVSFCTGKNSIGTVRYASINSSLGTEYARRDDMESLGYTFLYLMKGRLPWQWLEATTKKDRFKKVAKKKESISIDAMFKGYHEEFKAYMTHCRELNFTEAPDYKNLKNNFRNLFSKLMYEYDYKFDWLIKKDKKNVPDVFIAPETSSMKTEEEEVAGEAFTKMEQKKINVGSYLAKLQETKPPSLIKVKEKDLHDGPFSTKILKREVIKDQDVSKDREHKAAAEPSLLKVQDKDNALNISLIKDIGKEAAAKAQEKKAVAGPSSIRIQDKEVVSMFSAVKDQEKETAGKISIQKIRELFSKTQEKDTRRKEDK